MLSKLIFGALLTQVALACTSCQKHSNCGCHAEGHVHSDSAHGAFPFPPRNWLGHGVDLTTITPTDAHGVSQSVLSSLQFINFDPATTDATVGATTYTVPNNCQMSVDHRDAHTSHHHFKSGVDAARQLESDSHLAKKHLAVSVSSDTGYAIGKAFQETNQYSVFNFDERQYRVQFEDYLSYLNEQALIPKIQHLPTWDCSNVTVINQYRHFFNVFGSHVIVGASYGARYQVTAWGSNLNSTVHHNWIADVDAAYDGVFSNGHFDCGIKETDQYHTFSEEKAQRISVSGGDPALAAILRHGYENTTNYETYNAWVRSTRSHPDVTGYKLVNVWSLMSAAVSPILYNKAHELEHAYNWIVENPAVHWTYARFTVNSDWGKFTLLTPGAYLIADPANPWTAIPGAFVSETQVQWGFEHSGHFRDNVHIDFIIVNDGSPVDFQISHGSHASGSRSGRSSVSFNQNEYVNDLVSDFHWNQKWFWRKSVNAAVHVDSLKHQAGGRIRSASSNSCSSCRPAAPAAASPVHVAHHASAPSPSPSSNNNNNKHHHFFHHHHHGDHVLRDEIRRRLHAHFDF